MTTYQLCAVRILVRDWERACAFYGNTIGLQEKFRDPAMGCREVSSPISRIRKETL